MTLRYKNGALVRADGRLCTNCCDALIAPAGTDAAGVSGAGAVLWTISGGAIRDVVRTSSLIYCGISTGVSRWTLSGASVDTITSLNVNGIDVDSSGNVYIAHNRAGGVSVTKVNSSGASQWTYDTGGKALKIKLNADETEVAVVGERADNGGGNKTLWVLAAADGSERWTFQRDPNDLEAVSVDWDLAGNVYICTPETAIPVNLGGVHKINSTPALVWNFNSFSPIGGVRTYHHVATDNVFVYVSYTAVAPTIENFVAVNVSDGSVAWAPAEGGAAAALDSDGNLYAINAAGDVFSIDPSNGDTLWTAASVLDSGSSIHAGSKPGALPWACGQDYVVGDIRRHGGAIYECNTDHTSCAGPGDPDEPGVGGDWESFWDLVT